MSSPPDSSAAAPVVEPNDLLFRQLKAMYRFFKHGLGTGYRDDGTSESGYKAARTLNAAAARAPASVARCWDDMSAGQHVRMLDLLLEHYCRSRADENSPPPVSFEQLRDQVGYTRSVKNRQQEVPAGELAPFRRLDKFLHLLVTLYSSPIDGREYEAFTALRHDIGELRRQLTRARSMNQRGVGQRQALYDEAEQSFEDRLSEANSARDEHLQQVKAAFSLLHDNAALVTGSADNAHQAAVEVYFARLDPRQQAAVVTQVRDFVFAACEERAVRGEALDPDAHLVGILHALHAYGLGHALCAARLKTIVRWVESRGAPPAFVEPFQDVVDHFCGDVWAHRFPLLAPSQQLYAINMVRDLLGSIHTLKPRQVVNELAAILPMNSPNPASWKHAHEANDPHVALHSLARSTSTRRAPFDADSTGSSTSSRYFPQARSARW